MAVLVRAGARTIPTVRRASPPRASPSTSTATTSPLRHEPAVTPLLTALRAVAEAELVETDAGRGRRAPKRPRAPGAGARWVRREARCGGPESPARVRGARPTLPRSPAPPRRARRPEAPSPDHGPPWLDTETALTLLASPLAGMDAADLRRLGRALREEERAAGNHLPPPSDELLARALAEPERLVAHDPAYARGAQRLGALLRKAGERLAGGGTAEEALWELWDGTPWPRRLERAARRGGAAGRNADRDLDAVCALFATRPARRSAPAGAAPSTSWRRPRRRTSPPTPSPAGPYAPTPYA